MEDLPETIRNSVPPELFGEASAWWQSLEDDDRRELQRLCDAKKELFLFETFSESSDIKVHGGRFISSDDNRRFEEWGEDYFDYLLGNPELVLVHDPEHRTFHIGCTLHANARQCYSNRMIDDSFHCPFDSTRCRMRQILGTRNTIGVRLMVESTHHELQPSARSAVLTCVESTARTG